MKPRNEIIIDNVRHVLVKDKRGSCSVCSLRSNCDRGIWCIQLMHDSYSHFEIKENLILRLLLLILKRKHKSLRLKNPF